jgi:hypothetical protein
MGPPENVSEPNTTLSCAYSDICHRASGHTDSRVTSRVCRARLIALDVKPVLGVRVSAVEMDKLDDRETGADLQGEQELGRALPLGWQGRDKTGKADG